MAVTAQVGRIMWCIVVCFSREARKTHVYNILVWKGKGDYGGFPVESGVPGMDELLITHDTAASGMQVKNTGSEEMLILKFYGPEINPDAPMIPQRWQKER